MPRRIGSLLPSPLDQARGPHWQYWTQAGPVFLTEGTRFTFAAQLGVQFSFALASCFPCLVEDTHALEQRQGMSRLGTPGNFGDVSCILPLPRIRNFCEGYTPPRYMRTTCPRFAHYLTMSVGALGKNPCSRMARAASSSGANQTDKAACSSSLCGVCMAPALTCEKGAFGVGRGGC